MRASTGKNHMTRCRSCCWRAWRLAQSEGNAASAWRRHVMDCWDQKKWVNDDGLRCYFTERDRGGPTRLECYRRLLREPEGGESTRRAWPGFLTACAAAFIWYSVGFDITGFDIRRWAWRIQPIRRELVGH